VTMSLIRTLAISVLIPLALLVAPALAQTPGTLTPQRLPPLANFNDPNLPAKELFGRRHDAAPMAARAIGSYARGCVAGGQALAVDGPSWQVMRLSRNRNWGHPAMIAFLERLAARVPAINGWPGLLVGDISQPRGGPMLTGHASHQLGLDADIWLSPMPDRRLSAEEREFLSATNVVAENRLDVDPKVWTPAHTSLIREVSRQPEVERIFVNAAIKKALCREAGSDRGWLRKVRPLYGHNYHFHIRLGCPAGETACEPQATVPAGDGCDETLAWWFSDEAMNPRPGKPRAPLRLADLPAECARVVITN